MTSIVVTPGDRVSAWLRRHELFVDGLAALLVVVVSVGLGLLSRPDWASPLLSVGLVAPLVLRRGQPALCLVAVLAVALVQWLTVRDGIGALPADLAVPLAVHAAAAYGPAWASRLGLSAGFAGAVLSGIAWPQLAVPLSVHVLTGAFMGATVLAAWAIGALHRAQHKQIGSLAERARLLEVEREQRDRLAVFAERTRIARDMHDILAHSLAAVIAQADGGRYATSAAAREAALATIGEHARQALTESRRVLGVLRAEPEQTSPQPGLADLPVLVERLRAGGLAVELDLTAASVDAGVSLVAYRIVQEGLTNVLKHAGPGAAARVLVCRERDQLLVEVRDTGRGAASGGSGYGLIGMRERAAAYGGTVTFGSPPGGGHLLSARLPA